MVYCTTPVHSRIPQQSSGSPRISHDSHVWGARRGGGEGDIRRDHATLQVRACSRDGRRPNNHETCSLDGAWVWYPIEKRVRNFRQGFPRLCGPRKLRYCTGGCTPGLGGYPSLCGGPTECSWTEGWEQSWMAGGGPGSPGRSRLRARPGPLSWCPTGSFCRVVSCRLLRSSRRRTASKPRPLLPDRPQLSLIADAPHVFKSRGIRPSQRLGDTSMPPEVMGMLDR